MLFIFNCRGNIKTYGTILIYTETSQVCESEAELFHLSCRNNALADFLQELYLSNHGLNFIKSDLLRYKWKSRSGFISERLSS